MRPRLLASMVLLFGHAAHAGTTCRNAPIGPAEVSRATDAALATQHVLDGRGDRVALIARIGQDLSRYGLKYSHVAFVVRDHPDGRWTVVHLLNECGTDHSDIYAEGLVNFYADGLVSDETAIVWLDAALGERLGLALAGTARRTRTAPRGCSRCSSWKCASGRSGKDARRRIACSPRTPSFRT